MMIRHTSSLRLALVVLLGSLPVACTSEAKDSNASASKPSKKQAAEQGAKPPMSGAMALTPETVAGVWPESGSRVFDTFDLVVGPAGSTVDGQVAVIAGSEPVPAGQMVDDALVKFPAGSNTGAVTLKAGTQKICVQVLDKDGKSRGPDWSTALEYDVVAGKDPKVFFIEPKDGATVSTRFKVKFGVSDIEIAPKMTKVDDKTVGHHHLIINSGPVPAGAVVPTDDQHIHYGGGQTEAEIQLQPGVHELTMQLADGNHRSFGKRFAQTIKITVK